MPRAGKNQRYGGGSSKHKVDGSVLKPIGDCNHAKSIAGSVAVKPEKKGYSKVEGAVSGEKKF